MAKTISNFKVYRLPWTVRQRFYEQASSQLANGLGITEVLSGFRKTLIRQKRRKSARTVEQTQLRMINGETFTEAMRESLTNLERGVLAAGEHVSNLPGAMRLVLDVRSMTTSIRRKLQSTLFSPLTYLVAFWMVLFTLGHSVIPQLALAVPTSHWTGWAAVLNALGSFATGWYGPVALAVVAGIGAGVWMALPRWTGRGRIFCDRWVLPFIVYREINGFVWLISYCALVRAGVTNTDALEGQIANASPWLASRLRPIRVGLRDGERMDEAMRSSRNGFPSEDLVDEIGAYIDYPDFSEKIETVAREYAKTLERKLVFRGMFVSGLFGGLMYFAFLVLQLGSNEISSLINASVGAGR
ncbi:MULTISPECIES: type II secretion system F family protein [unclassified Paraburkholderia]|uniref:type II secretion system F family protein n=1 Tax=unclassified Paraburkholderia TaxID=2615204 RepID=UPI002AB2F6F2|nr:MULTISPECIES: type II secretion system F family protein [unclassified Paraburkholderia]